MWGRRDEYWFYFTTRRQEYNSLILQFSFIYFRHCQTFKSPKFTSMAPIDPHSYTDSTHPFTTHISLSLYFDFPASEIYSSALLSLSSPHTGSLSLDTRSLSINSIVDPKTLTPIPFSLSSEIGPIKGALLTVTLSNQSEFLISFKTSPNSSALQWL